jgi:uncharacterized membrane protein
MEAIVDGLEFVGVAVIVIAFVNATARALLHFGQRRERAYERFRGYVGKALQLGLEFLIAADVIGTVVIDPSMERVLSLGVLIAVRTLLSWSITVETEGCWPWQVAKNRATVSGDEGSGPGVTGN